MQARQLDIKVVHSESLNPWHNLALEEHLLQRVEENQVILYLWQNKNTVVIGRNQNPWKECKCNLLENEGGKLARRLSGGGAVYHDMGNLNFTFVLDKRLYNLENQLRVILQAVQKLGANAQFTGRNDLTVDGKKFSGNAFYFDTHSAYHHGTLLVNTDFAKMMKYLQVSKEKIASKGIESIQSRVVNLAALNSDITIESLSRCLVDSFMECYGGEATELSMHRYASEIEHLYEKYASWEWRYGETPSFDITFSSKFDWGEIEIGLRLKNGYTEEATIYSDAMEYGLMQRISSALRRCPFEKQSLISRIVGVSESLHEQRIVEELKEWLLTKQI